MRAEEFGGWKANNVGKGGKKSSYDAFNKSMKGHERNPSAKEFYTQGLDEYHHYAERMDTRTEKDDNKNDTTSFDNNNNKTNSSRASGQSTSFVRNIVSKVALVAVGSVVVVNGYQTIQEHKEQNVIPIVSSVTWNWSIDNQSATVALLDNDNTLIKQIPTTVYISQEDATCTEDGKITYIATAVDEDGKTYTDTQTDILPASGHDNHVIKKEYVKNENGEIIKVITDLECSKCHEKSTVSFEVMSKE